MPTMNKKITFIKNLLKEQQWQEALQELLTWQPVLLASFYIENIEYQLFLKNDVFIKLWEVKINQLKNHALGEFNFVIQPDLAGYNLFIGYFFYLNALRSKQQKEDFTYTAQLKNAMNYQSFHAHQTVLHELFITPVLKLEDKLENIVKTLFSWEAFAKLHGTPGNLLLAKGYMQLAKLSADCESDIQAKTAYFLAWRHLHLAKHYEKKSEESINNAYFGQGLGLSNPFGFKTINEMLLACSKVAHNQLSALDKSRAEEEAKQLLKLDVELYEPKPRAGP